MNKGHLKIVLCFYWVIQRWQNLSMCCHSSTLAPMADITSWSWSFYCWGQMQMPTVLQYSLGAITTNLFRVTYKMIPIWHLLSHLPVVLKLENAEHSGRGIIELKDGQQRFVTWGVQRIRGFLNKKGKK